MTIAASAAKDKSAAHRRWISRRVIDFCAASLLAASVVALAASGAAWIEIKDDNEKIAALRADQDLAATDRDSAQLILARASFLLAHGRIDEAQALAEALARRGDQDVYAKLLFNLGNARLRQAFELISNGDLSSPTPIVNLAKQDYRRALEIEPEDWNAKYNLDVAMRLVRDFPFGQENEGDVLPESKKLWPDMPGVPEGLP